MQQKDDGVLFGFSKKKEKENTGCQLSIDGGGVKAPERDHGIGFTTFRIESKEIFFEIVQETRSALCSKIKEISAYTPYQAHVLFHFFVAKSQIYLSCVPSNIFK